MNLSHLCDSLPASVMARILCEGKFSSQTEKKLKLAGIEPNYALQRLQAAYRLKMNGGNNTPVRF